MICVKGDKEDYNAIIQLRLEANKMIREKPCHRTKPNHEHQQESKTAVWRK